MGNYFETMFKQEIEKNGRLVKSMNEVKEENRKIRNTNEQLTSKVSMLQYVEKQMKENQLL